MTETAPASSVDSSRCLGEIDRRRNLTPEAFWHEYHVPGKPVLLEGAIAHWRSMEEWSLEFFREQCRDDVVPVGQCFGPKDYMPLGTYIDRMHEFEDSRGQGDAGRPPPYMEGWYYIDQRPDLGQYYDVLTHFGEDMFFSKRWPFQMSPEPHALLIGPKGAFTKLHYDLWASHSWNAQVVGRKEWILISPKYRDRVYLETRQGGGYVPGTDVETPDLTRYPKLGQVPYFKSVVNPGDIVYFPSLWMHQVTSLDDTISVTHNYLSSNIYWRVLGRYLVHRFLKKQGI